MRMLEPDGAGRLGQVQLYLSVEEARELARELGHLLTDPEANEHFHVFSRDGGAELSVSIVAQAKLAGGEYTAEELAVFGKWKPAP